MKRAELKEILQCLPKYKKRFYYFRDRYALLLLKLAIENTTTKKGLRSTRFSKLLDKDVVRAAIKQCRDSVYTSEDFDAYWPVHYECYYLTLGVWGSQKSSDWHQTSRTGYNLVLQMNFSSKHDEPYRKLVDPEDNRPFEFGGHPVNKGSLHTLAWARIDIDLNAGEALIEEIQNDWIREALWERRYAARRADAYSSWWNDDSRDQWIMRYVDAVLKNHEKMWDEAMLSATLWFLREEIGIRKIYYHTHTSGAVLKKISGSLPPQSLYSRLPKRFCFKRTDEVPGLLRKNVRSATKLKKLQQSRFQSLEF